MNEFEKGLTKYISKEVLEYVQNIKIGIAGAGGLGSNCAFNLLRSGFKKFVIADFDVVEFSNLNRQFYFSDQAGKLKVEALEENLKRINHDALIEISDKKFEKKDDLKIFDGCHAVVEAFDKSFYKKMIVEYFLKKGVLLVAASGIAGCGKSDDIKIVKAGKNFYIVGDMISEAGKENPPFSPYINIAAAKQADIIADHYYKEAAFK